jgi:hypothetical protein
MQLKRCIQAEGLGNLYFVLGTIQLTGLRNFLVLPKRINLVLLSHIINELTIATTATDKLTRIAYKQKKPKKAHIAVT